MRRGTQYLPPDVDAPPTLIDSGASDLGPEVEKEISDDSVSELSEYQYDGNGVDDGQAYDSILIRGDLALYYGLLHDGTSGRTSSMKRKPTLCAHSEPFPAQRKRRLTPLLRDHV